MFSFRVKDVDVSHRLDPRPLTVPDVAKHYHAMYEIFYFVRGDACLITELGQCALRPGDVMFIRPGQHHIVALDRETPYERYVLKFSVGFVPEHVIDRFGPDVASFVTAIAVCAMPLGQDAEHRGPGHAQQQGGQ